MMEQIEDSDFVLVVCTEKYKLRYRSKEERGQGRGATWEGGLIIAELYSGQGVNDKFIPVLLSSEGEEYIPRSLQAYTIYRLLSSNSYDPNEQGEYQNLYRHLTKQPAYLTPQLGEPQILPPINGASSIVGGYGEIIQAKDSIEEEKRLQQAEQMRQQQVIEAENLKQQGLCQQQQAQLNQERINKQEQSSDASKGDYARLEDLLKAKKWKEADEQTKKIILTDYENSLLTAPNIRQLSLNLLNNIDHLWMRYSDEKFGLRIQRQLWQKILEPEKKLRLNPFAKKVEPLTDSQAWNQFGCLVGWRSSDEKLLPDVKLDFSMKAPSGCFPRSRLWLHGGHGNTVKQFVILMQRVAELD